MPETFIPGFLGTIIIGVEDISAIGQVTRLNMVRNNMKKPVFGSQWSRTLGGQRSGTFSANGHVAAEKASALQTLFETDAAVAFSIQIGDAAGPTDGGIYTGDMQISNYTIEADADDEWKWSIEASTDGVVDYAPPAP